MNVLSMSIYCSCLNSVGEVHPLLKNTSNGSQKLRVENVKASLVLKVCVLTVFQNCVQHDHDAILNLNPY